jgi:hypothetical protein
LAVALRQFRKHRLAVWGGRILLVLYLMAAFAGFFSPYDPNYYELYPPKGHHPPTRIHFVDPETGRLTRPFVYATKRSIDPVTLQPKYEEDPSQGKFYVRFFVRTPEHPYTIFKVFRSDLRLFGVDPPGRIFLMGTDNFGRDLFSRVVYGGQVSLTIGILSALVSFALGLLLGGIAGYFSGRPFRLSLPPSAWRGVGLLLGLLKPPPLARGGRRGPLPRPLFRPLKPWQGPLLLGDRRPGSFSWGFWRRGPSSIGFSGSPSAWTPTTSSCAPWRSSPPSPPSSSSSPCGRSSPPT